MNNFLTKFDRYDFFESRADFSEQIGDVGLGLLHIGLGTTYTIERIVDEPNTQVQIENYSTVWKVAAIALFILAFPITVSLAAIGCMGVLNSASREQISDLVLTAQKFQVAAIIKEHIQEHLAPDVSLRAQAAVTIQKHVRGHLARRAYSRIQAAKKDQAAAMIQKYIRGHLARKSHLPTGLYPHYSAQCKKANGPNAHLIPKAQSGKTIVYLPSEMSGVVLKDSGRKDAVKRFHQMQEVRAILRSQNSSHLVVPRANLCDSFLVEERLPLEGDTYHNMKIYISQPELFDEAVREMTRLFSKVYIGDLVSWQRHPLGHIADVGDFVRYDNLPLYIVEENGTKKGKIGLIDLEHLKSQPKISGLQDLARIFPYHADLIQEEAKKLRLTISDGWLSGEEEAGKKFLQVGFIDHLAHINRKNISPSNRFSQTFDVSPERIQELAALVEKELLKLNQGINNLVIRRGLDGKAAKNFLGDSPEDAAKRLAPEIASLMISSIQKKLESHVEKWQKRQSDVIQLENVTDSQLVSFRSPVIPNRDLYKKVQSIIRKETPLVWPDIDTVPNQLLCAILEELVKGGEIFYFDPMDYICALDKSWIRY